MCDDESRDSMLGKRRSENMSGCQQLLQEKQNYEHYHAVLVLACMLRQ